MGHGAQCSPDEKLPVGTRELYQDGPENPLQYSPSALEIPVREEIPECNPPLYWILEDWVYYDLPDPDSGIIKLKVLALHGGVEKHKRYRPSRSTHA